MFNHVSDLVWMIFFLKKSLHFVKSPAYLVRNFKLWNCGYDATAPLWKCVTMQTALYKHCYGQMSNI